MWTVPASRMKGRREHRVPLSDSGIAIIKAMPADAEYLFPGAKPGKPMSNMAMQMTLRRMGLADQAVTHGFRSTSPRLGSRKRAAIRMKLLEMAIAHVRSPARSRPHTGAATCWRSATN